MRKDVSMTVRISSELKAALDQAATDCRRSTSSVVTEILNNWAGLTVLLKPSVGVRGEPRLVPPPGRPRSDATRARYLEQAGALLPWVRQLIGENDTRTTIPAMLEKAAQSATYKPSPGIEQALANALHGLGWTEFDEIRPDGTSERIWTC